MFLVHFTLGDITIGHARILLIPVGNTNANIAHMGWCKGIQTLGRVSETCGVC